RFVVHELLQLSEVSGVGRVHHVETLAATVGKLHWLYIFLGREQWIHSRLFCLRGGRRWVGAVLALLHNGSKEQKDIVGLRFEREVALRNLAVVIRREQKVETTTRAVRANRADIGNGALEEIGEHANDIGRRGDHQRPGLLQ